MGQGGVQRTFLGWDRPLVGAVVEHLIGRCPAMDFRGVHVVVTGGRAGRRIISLLADEAESRKLAMVPPVVLTLGALPDRLVRPTRPVAGTFARRIAWATALRNCAEKVKPIFPRLGSSADAFLSAARMMEHCHQELAAAVQDFASVAQPAGEKGSADRQRWEAGACAYEHYLRALKAEGQCDIQQVRNAAIRRGSALAAPGPIILAGVPQVTEQVRRLLALVDGPVEALVFAPEALADHFDELGCVRCEKWNGRPIDVSAADLRTVQTPSDQADEVFAAMAAGGRPIRPDQVTVGVPDEMLVPFIEARAEHLGGVAVRFGAGIPVARTRPYQFVASVADYLESGRFREFARLVRHPDVDRWLREQSRGGGDGGGADGSPGASAEQGTWRDWRSLLDRYAADVLPDRLGPAQLQPEGWLGEADPERGMGDDRPDLAWLYARISELLSPVVPGDVATRRTPAGWSGDLRAVLGRAYGRSWKQSDPAQARVIDACLCLRDALDELGGCGSAEAKMTAAEAARAALSLVASSRVAPPQTGREIELVGWLELLPDDAGRLIITGFNDGIVPESSGGDPFLIDSVRKNLGLACDEDRCARDAYLLTAMIASRPAGSVTLISGRLSPEGDPLLPSRLLFACDYKTMARRVLEAVKAEPSPRPPLAYRVMPGQTSAFFAGARMLPRRPRPIESMRVTSFRDYIASPQGFYLKHVLGLQTLLDSAPRELEASQCGQLVHEVMKAFAAGPCRDSTSGQQCTDAIVGSFRELVAQRFGTSVAGTLKFQLALLERRLKCLAEWQAKWAGEGWRIRHSEWEPGALPMLMVDERGMGLRGRIDRFDFNERTGEWAVLDYKLGRKRTPDETHLCNGQWRDLQLPLYIHLAREVVRNDAVKVGYVCIAPPGEVGAAMADWDRAMLASAEEKAAEIIRKVRKMDFAEKGDDPPTDGIFAHIFGQELIDEAEGDERPEGGAA